MTTELSPTTSGTVAYSTNSSAPISSSSNTNSIESLTTNTNTTYFSSYSLVTSASSPSPFVSGNTTVTQAGITVLSSATQSSTTAIVQNTTVVTANATQASLTFVTTPKQTLIATSSTPASTSTAATFGYFSAKSITDFANKFAIIGVAALVLGLGCAFVVYRRINSEEVEG